MYVIVEKFESVYYKKCVKAQTRIRLSGQNEFAREWKFTNLYLDL